MALTDIACKNAKAGPKPRKLSDDKGLYLEVSPTGGKYWRLKYRYAGKEKRLALGVYPEVSLNQALTTPGFFTIKNKRLKLLIFQKAWDLWIHKKSQLRIVF